MRQGPTPPAQGGWTKTRTVVRRPDAAVHVTLDICLSIPLSSGVRSYLNPAWRPRVRGDRKSTRLNSSHLVISYAVFCLKKKNNAQHQSYFVSSFFVFLQRTITLDTSSSCEFLRLFTEIPDPFLPLQIVLILVVYFYYAC